MESPRHVKTGEDIQEKIEELRAYDDYGIGPAADNLKYKHQGWIDALQWVLGQNPYEEPK